MGQQHFPLPVDPAVPFPGFTIRDALEPRRELCRQRTKDRFRILHRYATDDMDIWVHVPFPVENGVEPDLTRVDYSIRSDTES
tara:strand:- start:17 stop:265 length:249 start_codon:yes stop_codon:yes gene_type:complete